MKKRMIIVLALAAALVLACSAACAEGRLPELVKRITDAENPIAFIIATVEYDEMTPVEGYSPVDFVNVLSQSELIPFDGEAPEGIYTVLNFPDEGVRYDFFAADPEKNLVRQVNADGTEELFTVQVPEDFPYTGVATMMEAEADYLADLLGLVEPVEAVLPEEGWVLDSVIGKVCWMDDRALLEVFLEDVDTYKVLITWGNSAFDNVEWVYAGSYDAETQSIRASHVTKDLVEYDDDVNETRKEEYNRDSEAVFSLNAEGKVVITNAGEDILEGKAFEMVETPEEEADVQ